MSEEGPRTAPRFFDFHIHTRASDGSRTAAEVLRLASGAGLEGISITDHDTVDAYRELSSAASCGRPWVLAGVELSTRLDGDDAHIIGYFPGGISPAAASYVEEILGLRRRRMAEGIVKLRERGIDVSWEDCARLATGRVLSRSHVAEALVAKKYVGRAHRAYPDLLGPGVLPLPGVEARDAVHDIGRLGGVAVWAHPSAKHVEAHLGSLQAAGLAGVEVLIPRRSPAEREVLAVRVRAAGLLVTGGSDWHGRPSGPEFGKFRVAGGAVGEFLRAVGR